MRSKRSTVLGLSVLLGAVAATAGYEYLHGAQDRAYANARMVPVYVLSQPVPRGVSGDQAISSHLIKTEEIPLQFRPGTSITDLAMIQGKVAMANLPPGQVLVDGLFVSPQAAELTFSQRIPKGDVAVTVSVDQVHGVAGLPVPGDQVDILTNAGGTEHVLLQNVPILAIGDNPAPQPGDAPAATTATTAPKAQATNANGGLVTFSVPAVSAERIVMVAQGQGGIWLALVPPDNKASTVPPTDQGNLFTGPITPN